MPLSYLQNKSHIYKWREQNIDKYRSYDALRKRKCYAWKKIKIEFLHILL